MNCRHNCLSLEAFCVTSKAERNSAVGGVVYRADLGAYYRQPHNQGTVEGT